MIMDGDSGRASAVDSGSRVDAGAVSSGESQDQGGFQKQPELFQPQTPQDGERLYAGRYKSVEDLEKGYDGMRKIMGENGKYRRESLEGYLKRQGWYNPASAPEQYDWSRLYPDGIGENDQDGMNRAAQHFRETGQTQDQATANLQFFRQEMKDIVRADRQATSDKLKQAGIIWDKGAVEQGLQQRWGENWEAEGEATLHYMNANGALAKLVPFLAHRDFGWDVMRAIRLNAAGEQPLTQGRPAPDRALTLQDRIKEIVASEAFNTASHHRNKAAIEEHRELCRQLALIKYGSDKQMG